MSARQSISPYRITIVVSIRSTTAKMNHLNYQCFPPLPSGNLLQLMTHARLSVAAYDTILARKEKSLETGLISFY